VLVLDKIDVMIKWAVLGALFAGLTLLAACAERAARPGAQDQMPAASTPSSPRRMPKGPAPTSASMMGKSPREIESLLGAPTLLREETGAQIWQYANAHCVLLLYLYEDGADLYRVAHLEARIKDVPNDNVDVCLAATYNT